MSTPAVETTETERKRQRSCRGGTRPTEFFKERKDNLTQGHWVLDALNLTHKRIVIFCALLLCLNVMDTWLLNWAGQFTS